MPKRLKRDAILGSSPTTFRVILTMEDGYRLHIGSVKKKTGRGARGMYWAWSAPGAHGQASTREEAAEAIRAAWLAVTEAAMAAFRRE
ncbi:MAG: hypothetical protein JWQ24_272 [Tardiphaga sp.]|nr:hypothetical protein [Tardiphaga sp.]